MEPKMPVHIDPDTYLAPEKDDNYPIERIRKAWDAAYADLENALREAGAQGQLCMVCGLSRSGKTTWVKNNMQHYPENTVFFDAAVPARQHRTRALQLAKQYGVPASAVWMEIDVKLALKRNQELPDDDQLPESTVRHAFALYQQPSTDEGFAAVQIVPADADLNAA